MTDNVTWHENKISREERETLLNNKGKVVWLTGLSASGKSTIATIIEHKLHEQGKLNYILDGDNLRHGLNEDLGFSDFDREENIRRVREVARLMLDLGVVVIVSFISPFRKDRDLARELFGTDFVEVFVDCSLEKCEERDPKKLYEKARAGEIKEFTGINSPYEVPLHPEIIVNTGEETPEQSAQKVLSYILS